MEKYPGGLPSALSDHLREVISQFQCGGRDIIPLQAGVQYQEQACDNK
jgi:hypothetical protein